MNREKMEPYCEPFSQTDACNNFVINECGRVYFPPPPQRIPRPLTVEIPIRTHRDQTDSIIPGSLRDPKSLQADVTKKVRRRVNNRVLRTDSEDWLDSISDPGYQGSIRILRQGLEELSRKVHDN